MNAVILTALLVAIGLLANHSWTTWKENAAKGAATNSSQEGKRSYYSRISEGEEQIVDGAQVKKLLESSRERITILDIRDRASFKQEHPQSAVNIPSDELEARAEDELSKSSLIIVTNCACDGTDLESLIRRSTLVDLGFNKVLVLKNGVDGWRSAGLGMINQ